MFAATSSRGERTSKGVDVRSKAASPVVCADNTSPYRRIVQFDDPSRDEIAVLLQVSCEVRGFL